MIYVLVSLFVWLAVMVSVPAVRRWAVTPRLLLPVSDCPYCHGDSLILTYRDHYLKNPKCDKHLNQYEHIMDMENQFFGPPLKVKTISSYDSYWYNDAYANYRVGKKGYVKDGTCYLLESAKITFDRTCSFLSHSGYTVNLRFIDETLCYEIIDSLGQFAEIGVLTDLTLGFKLPSGPKPQMAKRNIMAVDEWTGEGAITARYLKERERI